MIKLPSTEVLGFVLALVRASAWVTVSPPFSNSSIPSLAKVGIAAGIALSAAPAAAAGGVPATTGGFLGAIVLQAAIGAAMGFLVQVAFEAFLSAGSVVDLFSGLNLPPSIDPLSLEQAPIIGQLYETVAFTLLFTSGADLLLVRGFISSFASSGIDLSSLGRLASTATADLAALFSSALEIAAPLIAVLFVAQVLLGLLAKAAPQMNVFVFGFGLQILLALLGLAMALLFLPQDLMSIIGRAVAQVFG